MAPYCTCLVKKVMESDAYSEVDFGTVAPVSRNSAIVTDHAPDSDSAEDLGEDSSPEINPCRQVLEAKVV